MRKLGFKDITLPNIAYKVLNWSKDYKFSIPPKTVPDTYVINICWLAEWMNILHYLP